MPLTKAQIAVLRHASEYSVWEADSNGLTHHHPFLPYKGAPARNIIRCLLQNGWIGANGMITVSGKGKLLTDPMATSELPS